MKYFIFILMLIIVPYMSSAGIVGDIQSATVKNGDDLTTVFARPNMRFFVRSDINLMNRTIVMGENTSLIFQDGSIENGRIIGNNTTIKYTAPFIGTGISFFGCVIKGKKVVRDKDVFLVVNHEQDEIQTLFDISGGLPLVFSQGTYHEVDKISINGNINANFNGSTIYLKEDIIHSGTCPCFYTEPWKDNRIDYFKIRNLNIVGTDTKLSSSSTSRRCILLFYISEVMLDNINFDKFSIGKEEYNSGDLLDKSRFETAFCSIMLYEKCTINQCTAKDVLGEMFWCVPGNDPPNITYFTNNKYFSGGWSFFTILDGRCIVKNNEVNNYKGSAFNAFCYDSEIAFNKFNNGERSIAIDLSEGTMYRARNVYVHDNECNNTKAMLEAYGEDIRVERNKWISSDSGDRRFSVIAIQSRGARVEGEEYVGGINNPDQDAESCNISIKKNIFINNDANKEHDVRGSVLYGNEITFSNNNFSGFHAPVAQLVNGRDFVFSSNSMGNQFTLIMQS